MTTDASVEIKTSGRWLGTAGLVGIHCVALMAAYAILVFFVPTFAEHYREFGIASTARFDSVNVASNWIAAYTLPVLVLIGAELASIIWIAKKYRNYLSAYSHVVMTMLGCVIFLSLGWMIQPMAIHAPNPNPTALTETAGDDSDLSATRTVVTNISNTR